MTLLHFQHYTIDDIAYEITPLVEHKQADAEVLSIVVVRDPYMYFDAMLSDYLHQRKSLLFTDDILEQIEQKDADAFLRWLDGLNFFPFYNPQIHYLDARKRLKHAFDNLENFEYVIPYEFLDVFLRETELSTRIIPYAFKPLAFSIREVEDEELIEKFIGKDRALYEKCLSLWQLITENKCKPLSDIIQRMPTVVPLHEAEGFRGGCGAMNEKMIRGFAIKSKHEEPLEIVIYKNKELLVKTKADASRPELQKKFDLLSDRCGIMVHFEEETILPGDRIDIVVMPEGISLPILGQAQMFLNGFKQ